MVDLADPIVVENWQVGPAVRPHRRPRRGAARGCVALPSCVMSPTQLACDWAKN